MCRTVRAVGVACMCDDHKSSSILKTGAEHAKEVARKPRNSEFSASDG
jgi:hypothetical protein